MRYTPSYEIAKRPTMPSACESSTSSLASTAASPAQIYFPPSSQMENTTKLALRVLRLLQGFRQRPDGNIYVHELSGASLSNYKRRTE